MGRWSGSIENTLANMLATVVGENQWDLNLQLPYLTVAYLVTTHPTTGFSPNFLVLACQ